MASKINTLLPICSLIVLAILPFVFTAKTSKIFIIEVDNTENKNHLVSPPSPSLYPSIFNDATATADGLDLSDAASVDLQLLDKILQTKNSNSNLIRKGIINNVDGAIRYTLGKRVPGDRLVAQNHDAKRYNVPQNVQLAIGYPASGLGALVTYVEINVSQTGNLGNASVISGGIGQRHVTIVVNSLNTLEFSYVSTIFGL